MNRKLMFGIAMFFVVLGFALVGGENEAVAGRGCHGGFFARGCGGCFGGGLFSRLHCRGAASCEGAVCDGDA